MTADVPILIIGGGIGGLTAALALARAGFTAHVVERSAEFGEIGGYLGFEGAVAAQGLEGVEIA